MKAPTALSICAVLLLTAIGCKHRSEPAHRAVAITVLAAQPGASAQQVATSVAAPLDRELGKIPNVVRLQSRSTGANTRITVDFADGTAVDQAARSVQSAITSAASQLPANLPTLPRYIKGAHEHAVLRLVLTDGTGPHLAEAAELIAQKLSQVLGVGHVSICGDATEYVQIAVDPQTLATSGRTLDDLIEHVQSIAARGETADDDIVNLLRGDFTTPSGPRRLSDVATIESRRTAPACRAFDSDPTRRLVEITVRPQPGIDSEPLGKRLAAVLPDLAAAVPPGVAVETFPETHAVSFELRVDPELPDARRELDVRALLADLPHDSTARALAELGANAPDTLELHLVPKGDAAPLEAAVRHSAALHHLDLYDLHDHIVGLSGTDATAVAAELGRLVSALKSHPELRVRTIGTGQTLVTALTPDLHRAEVLGVPANILEQPLRVLAPDGMHAATLYTPHGPIDVIISVAGPLPEALNRLLGSRHQRRPRSALGHRRRHAKRGARRGDPRGSVSLAGRARHRPPGRAQGRARDCARSRQHPSRAARPRLTGSSRSTACRAQRPRRWQHRAIRPQACRSLTTSHSGTRVFASVRSVSEP